MRALAMVLAIAAFVSAASCSSAQSLWQGTTYGMSVAQVKAVVPGATQPARPDSLGDGAAELLHIPELIIANARFRASFFFKAGCLEQVTLSLEDGHTFYEAMLLFDAVVDLLRSKYGPELSRKDTRDVIKASEATWMAGSTNIRLLALDIRSGAVLNVNYQASMAKDMEKL